MIYFSSRLQTAVIPKLLRRRNVSQETSALGICRIRVDCAGIRTMKMLKKSISMTSVLAVALVSPVMTVAGFAKAQAPAAANPGARQIGTVKAISGSNITLAADGGAQVTVTIADGAKILQLAPGSTDLKSAQQIALSDIAAGDRVLVTGKSA